jgi:hypothetical protein
MAGILERMRHDDWWIVVLQVAGSFIVGVAVSVLIEDGWAEENRNVAAGFFTIALVLLLLLAMLVHSTAKQRELNEIAGRNHQEFKEILQEMNTRIGLTVEYYPAAAEGEVFVKARQAIATATCSIHVLNSYLGERKDVDRSTTENDARAKYYEAIIDRVVNHSVEYKRVLQVEHIEPYLNEIGTMETDDHLRKHLAEMCQQRCTAEGKCSLLHCVPTRLTNFVIIDGVRLIWQIHDVVNEGRHERLRLEGAFIFHDPERKMTPHFDRYFNRLVSASDSVVWNGTRLTTAKHSTHGAAG